MKKKTSTKKSSAVNKKTVTAKPKKKTIKTSKVKATTKTKPKKTSTPKTSAKNKSSAKTKTQVTKTKIKPRNWKILVDNKYPKAQVDQKSLTVLCKNILKNFEVPGQYPLVEELSLVFCDDPSIQELNAYYRGKNKPTDVLSFSMLEGESGEISSSLGDIVISLDTAKVQAKKNKHPISQEVAYLVIHGILHLLGYDHEDVTKEEARMMFVIQDELMRRFGKAKLVK